VTFDLICLGIAVLFLILGLVRGLLRQLFGIIGFIGGIVLARMFAEALAQQIGPSLGLSPVIATVAISFAIFIAVEVLARVIANFLTDHLGAITGTANRLGGGAIGLLKGLLVVWVLASLMSLLHDHVPRAEEKIPLLARLDLAHSQVAAAALDKNFLGDVEAQFGKFSGLPEPLRKSAIEANRAAERAAKAAREAGKSATDAAQKAAEKAIQDAAKAGKQ
jgi:membrane protein required for colicin V production